MASSKQYPCRECSKYYSSARNLQKHVRTQHTKSLRFVCDKCSKAFTSKYSLGVHLSNASCAKRRRAGGAQTCEVCNKRYSSRGTLRKHARTLHAKTLRFVCDLCGKIFTSKYSLNQHVGKLLCRKKCHNPTFDALYCDACGHAFRSKTTLRSHISVVHAMTSRFVCEKCGKIFTKLYSLSKHLKLSCWGDLHLLRCPICKFSGTRSIMLDHFANSHDVRPTKEHIYFKSPERFHEWKESMERETSSKYVGLGRGKRTKGDGSTLFYYKCHRSGFHRPRSAKHARRPKRRGSRKIEGFCPSIINVRVHGNGTVSGEFWNTHIGHSCDASHLVSMRGKRTAKSELVDDKLVDKSLKVDTYGDGPCLESNDGKIVDKLKIFHDERLIESDDSKLACCEGDIDRCERPILTDLDGAAKDQSKDMDVLRQQMLQEFLDLLQDMNTPSDLEIVRNQLVPVRSLIYASRGQTAFMSQPANEFFVNNNCSPKMIILINSNNDNC